MVLVPRTGCPVRAALAALGLLAAIARAEVMLTVQPNRTQIYLGESLLLNVVVNGADDSQSVPDLTALPADVQYLGSQSLSRHMLQIINGHTSREDVSSRQFAFQVKPRAAGTFSTGPITLRTNGQRYAGRGPDVQVTGQEVQDLVSAHIAASRETVLVDEPFTITLSVAIANMPPPNEKYEPVLPTAPPHLDCTCLSQPEVQGLQTPDLKRLLEGLVTNDPRVPAVTINDYQTQSMDLFAHLLNGTDPRRAQPIRFRLPAQSVVRDCRACQEYTISLAYTPRQEGDYTFGPLVFKGPVITNADARGQALLREVFCVGPAVTVRVVPPPETNRPDCFIGSVGTRLAARAELDASICKVGDPLTLSLDLTGDISLGNMRPPILGLQPDLTVDFRIYDDNVESLSIPSGKRFRYRVRPLREGTLEVPPIQVAWFDTASRTYRMTRTLPIPVQSRANTQLVADSTNQPAYAMRLTVEHAAAAAPAAITVAAAGAAPARLLPPIRILALWLAAGPLAWLLAWGGRHLYRRRISLAQAYRRNRALALALATLRAAGPQPDAAQVGQTIRAFLAARLNVTGSVLTPGRGCHAAARAWRDRHIRVLLRRTAGTPGPGPLPTRCRRQRNRCRDPRGAGAAAADRL